MVALIPWPALHDPLLPLRELLRLSRARMAADGLAIDRIAFAHYEETTDLLTPYVSHGPDDSCPVFEPRTLANLPTLARLREQGGGLVINDLAAMADADHGHRAWMLTHGLRSSYSLPLLRQGRCLGFLFLNAARAGQFQDATLKRLEPHLDLLLLRIGDHFSGIATLHATLRLVLDMAGLRDRETGRHLERVSLYSRLIASQLEQTRDLPADFSDNLHRFAALHDVGKVGIPDRILLKPSPLTPDERQVMEQHVAIGVSLIDRVIAALNLEQGPASTLLRQVVAHHHERLDGSGYPEGLRGEAVSLAGRIVAVADVYDALTQPRPYKPAFTESQAFETINAMVEAGKLDRDCVAALLSCHSERQAILDRLSEPATSQLCASDSAASHSTGTVAG